MSLWSAVAIVASGSGPLMKPASTAASVRRGVRLDVRLVEGVRPGQRVRVEGCRAAERPETLVAQTARAGFGGLIPPGVVACRRTAVRGQTSPTVTKVRAGSPRASRALYERAEPAVSTDDTLDGCAGHRLRHDVIDSTTRLAKVRVAGGPSSAPRKPCVSRAFVVPRAEHHFALPVWDTISRSRLRPSEHDRFRRPARARCWRPSPRRGW
jgi:hypothetical protein